MKKCFKCDRKIDYRVPGFCSVHRPARIVNGKVGNKIPPKLFFVATRKDLQKIGVKCLTSTCEHITYQLSGYCGNCYARRSFKISFRTNSKYHTPAKATLAEFEEAVRKIEGKTPLRKKVL